MDSCKMRKRRASPSSSWLTTPATQALVDYWTTFVRLFRLNLRQRWPAWPTMNNNTLSIAQDLTNDHDKASKALRIPLGNPGANGSPYLSLMDLIKRWPDHGGRKEVLVISDGIDRFRRQRSRIEAMSPSTDADLAGNAA